MPTGKVTFTDGKTTLGTATLNASGVATFSTSSLAVAGHTISASYPGDAKFSGSTAGMTETVKQDATTITITPSPNPSVFGQALTFSVIVAAAAPGSGTPTGTVTFTDGGTTLGTATLNKGTASLNISTLIAGSHTISVVYSGSTTFLAGKGSLTQTVKQASTTTKLTTSSKSVAQGKSVTFTATVAVVKPGAGVPTGTVTFTDGTRTLGTATLNSKGQAVFTTSSLAAGTYTITAIYNSGANFTGSNGSVSQTVTGSSATAAQPAQATPASSAAKAVLANASDWSGPQQDDLAAALVVLTSPEKKKEAAPQSIDQVLALWQ